MKKIVLLGAVSLVLAVPVRADDAKNGFHVFSVYCMPCHGQYADGKGRNAKNLNPPPANLRISTVSDEYKEKIIRKGGAAMGRSQYMPPWGDELNDKQIREVIAYLRSINVGNARPAPKK